MKMSASNSTHLIMEVGRKAQDIASELRSTGILNKDSYLKMQQLLKSDLNDKVIMELGSGNLELWKTNCEELLKTLTEYSMLMEQYQLSTDNSSLKRKVEELERQVEELKRDVKDLQEKLKDLENTREKKLHYIERELGNLKKAIKSSSDEKGDCLMVGQLAYEVERRIVDHVLTKIIGPPQRLFINSLTNLQQALNREQNFTQPLHDDAKHEEAKKRWEDLQEQMAGQNITIDA